VAKPVDLPAFLPQVEGEHEVLHREATNAVQVARRTDALARLIAEPMGENDPRILYLRAQALEWRRRKEKVLLFVGERKSLTFLKQQLERETTERVAVFHEDLSPAQRDLEVARFANSEGPNLLIATEAGGEGRNFQFAKRLVLFDLPWDPVLVEQRIGRLDRITRRIPVEIVYFRPASGFGRQVAELYEALGIFRQPLGGLDRALGHVVQSIRQATETPDPRLDIETIIAETHEMRQRVIKAMYHHLHQNGYHAGLERGILDRLPEDLEKRTASVVLGACEQFRFDIEHKVGRAVWYLEFGYETIVEALHGVPQGSRFLGTFDRAEAVANESLEFFASGHPLVEGILGELADGKRGQVALLEFSQSGLHGEGFIFIDRHAADFTLRAFDLQGKEQPAWSRYCLHSEHRSAVVSAKEWNIPDWPRRTREFFSTVALRGKLIAVAGVRFS